MAHGSTGHQMPPGHEARNPGFGGQLWAAAWPKTFWLFVGKLVPAFRSFSFRVSSGGLKFERFLLFLSPQDPASLLQCLRFCKYRKSSGLDDVIAHGRLDLVQLWGGFPGWVPVTQQCLGDWFVRQQILALDIFAWCSKKFRLYPKNIKKLTQNLAPQQKWQRIFTYFYHPQMALEIHWPLFPHRKIIPSLAGADSNGKTWFQTFPKSYLEKRSTTHIDDSRFLQMSRSGLVLMFCGPSGTGKTLMVNALAAHLEKRVLLVPRLLGWSWDGGSGGFGDGVVCPFLPWPWPWTWISARWTSKRSTAITATLGSMRRTAPMCWNSFGRPLLGGMTRLQGIRCVTVVKSFSPQTRTIIYVWLCLLSFYGTCAIAPFDTYLPTDRPTHPTYLPTYLPNLPTYLPTYLPT